MADPAPSFKLKPRKPRLALPKGACDTHFHIVGPPERFPYAADRSYTPASAAPKEALLALHKHLGIERGVVVQTLVHAFDNSASADLLASNRNYRGVALLPASTSTQELERLDKAGFRGVRFHYMDQPGSGVAFDEVLAMARRLAGIGWHLQIHTHGPRIAEVAKAFAAAPVPVVIDHMGRVDASRGVDDPEFKALLAFLRNKHVWVKVSGSERISKKPSPWPDAAPFATKLVSEFGDRCVWGTDWPHPNLAEVPDDGELTDLIGQMAPTEKERQALLVDNPRRLYGFAA